MTDKREEIILLMAQLLSQVSGITAVYRDRGELPDPNSAESKLPAIVLLSGKERLLSKLSGRMFVQMPPAMFVLSPMIFLVLRPRDTIANETLDGANAPIGPELSSYRIKILKAMRDENLGLLLGPNGQVEYFGCDVLNEELAPIIVFHFNLTYLLDPSDL